MLNLLRSRKFQKSRRVLSLSHSPPPEIVFHSCQGCLPRERGRDESVHPPFTAAGLLCHVMAGRGGGRGGRDQGFSTFCLRPASHDPPILKGMMGGCDPNSGHDDPHRGPALGTRSWVANRLGRGLGPTLGWRPTQNRLGTHSWVMHDLIS